MTTPTSFGSLPEEQGVVVDMPQDEEEAPKVQIDIKPMIRFLATEADKAIKRHIRAELNKLVRTGWKALFKR